MFFRKINSDISISLSVPIFAEELFLLTDKNRAYLREWLPWLDRIKSVDDTRDFLQLQSNRFSDWESLHVTIFYEGKIAGVAGYNTIEKANRIGYIGYWLGEEYTGKGIMTMVVEELIKVGKDYYNLQKVDIRCATANTASRAIPLRLEFKYEGTLSRAEKVYDKWYDHAVYAMLLD